MAAKQPRKWGGELRNTAVVCAPVMIALAGMAAVDLGATRVDTYSRSQLGARYERPDASDDESDSSDAQSDFDNLWSAAGDDGGEAQELDGAESQELESRDLPLESATSDAHPVVQSPPAAPKAWLQEPPQLGPVLYESGGESGDDPHSAFLYEQFNPLGYGSISHLSEDAFAAGLVERRWSMLDPAFRNRIWLRSLYPYPRAEEGSDEIAGVLTASGLNSRYQRIRSSFELMARAAATGNHDDAKTFLAAYRKCIAEKRCEGYDFYERAVTNIHDIYTMPAALLLAKGHCVRAKYLNGIGLRLLRAADPPRFAARGLVNRMYMISAIAEQPQCPGQGATVALGVRRELFGDEKPPTEPDSGISPLFRASLWEGHLPNLYRYTRAAARFRLRDFTGTLQSLDAIDDQSGTTLDDMASLMRTRALFELAKGRADTATTVRPLMQDIVAHMGPSSLRTDASEYLADVEAGFAQASPVIAAPEPATGISP